MFVRSVVFLVMIVAVGACGGGGGDGCAFFGGGYNGTVSDEVFGNGTVTASIFQDGCFLNGSGQVCFQQGCDSGPITGFGDRRDFSLTLASPGSPCQVQAFGMLSGDVVSGSYFRQNCNTGGGGNFVASR